MFQIIFNAVSSKEVSQLPKELQLEILSEFNFFTPDYVQQKPEKFGQVKQGERTLYRYRAKDFRIYFEHVADGLLIHRVLSKNSIKDFFFRSQIPFSEDEDLKSHPQFWEFIDTAKKN